VDAGGGQTAFPVGANPKGVVVAGGDVWGANTDDGTGTHRSTAGKVLNTVKVGEQPRGLAAGFDRVWAAVGGDPDAKDPQGAVAAIDVENPEKVESLDLSGSPEEIATGPERMWVTTGSGDQLFTINP
jgi:hypothetical protein